MSEISKINIGGTEYDLKDAAARTEIQPVARGGTGAATAAAARDNLGAAATGHSHSYLPLSGGTVTGNLTVSQQLIPGGIRFAPGNGFGTEGHHAFKLSDISGTNQSSLDPAVDTANTVGSASKRYNTMYAANGMKTSSDYRLKKNIGRDFSALAQVFAALSPVTYEYADMADGQIRIGFIAQEVAAALAEEGFTADDFALLSADEIAADSDMARFIGDTTVYSLNYSEFVALNTAMIQQLQQENEALKSRLQIIEERLESL